MGRIGFVPCPLETKKPGGVPTPRVPVELTGPVHPFGKPGCLNRSPLGTDKADARRAGNAGPPVRPTRTKTADRVPPGGLVGTPADTHSLDHDPGRRKPPGRKK